MTVASTKSQKIVRIRAKSNICDYRSDPAHMTFEGSDDRVSTQTMIAAMLREIGIPNPIILPSQVTRR